jgi:lipid-binding SYLF domain-containing protein
MRFSSVLRSALVALTAIVGVGFASSAARADVGSIRITVLKGGWVVGAQGGSGVLTFRGKNYPLSVGGLSIGFTFGAAQTRLVGRVRNINRPSDVAGVYGAGGAGAAVGVGAGVIVLTNEKGAILELSGRQAGLMVNADLSGLVLSLR